MESPSPWPAVRAALIALVIGVNLLIAIPVPGRLDTRKLDQPDAQEELAAWQELLGSVGLDIDPHTLREGVITASHTLADVRQTWIAKPTRPLRRWLGIRQAWALFARPDTFPTILVIDGRTGPKAPWSELYRSHHPEHDTLRPQIRFRRVRGIYDASANPAAAARNVFRWSADRILEQQPELGAVRVRLIRAHSVRPDRPADPTQRVVHEQVFEREGP